VEQIFNRLAGQYEDQDESWLIMFTTLDYIANYKAPKESFVVVRPRTRQLLSKDAI
jgi:hypothetical protein